MKLNISHPSNGSQTLIDVEDERKLRVFMDKRVRGVLSLGSFQGSWYRCRLVMGANPGLLHFSRETS
jgi:hypothetical protein